MSMNDSLANALSLLSQHEGIGRREVNVKPSSKTIKIIFDLLNKEGYLGSYEEVNDGRGGYLKVNLIGRINKCGAIKPRFSVKITDYEMREKQFLPAKGFGFLIISTSEGIITHLEAVEKGLGGILIAYCY